MQYIEGLQGTKLIVAMMQVSVEVRSFAAFLSPYMDTKKMRRLKEMRREMMRIKAIVCGSKLTTDIKAPDTPGTFSATSTGN